jgi:DNA-binding NtrC family response regulator
MLDPSSSVRAEPGAALVGSSPGMVALRAEIAAAARTQAKVLIIGETGVGKEVVARLLHAGSPRRASAFVAVNCSGIPETLLESELFGHAKGSFTGAYRDKRGLVRQADRGTLFLDELGEMSLRMQAVLLRFTETGEIQPVGADAPGGRADVRLITATHRDLRVQIANGTFREDLYYRLNVLQIHVPPLRERGDDILQLVEHYLKRAAADHGRPTPVLSSEAAQCLLDYAWPGNVRELRNITERLVLQDHAVAIAPSDLPLEIASPRRAASPMPQAAPAVRPAAPVASAPQVSNDTADRLWARMAAGEDFWSAVHQGFKSRALTRSDLLALIDRGLKTTRGSYRALLGVFNLPPTDYKRFHAFLYQQQCNLPVGPYRRMPTRAPSTPDAVESSFDAAS